MLYATIVCMWCADVLCICHVCGFCRYHAMSHLAWDQALAANALWLLSVHAPATIWTVKLLTTARDCKNVLLTLEFGNTLLSLFIVSVILEHSDMKRHVTDVQACSAMFYKSKQAAMLTICSHTGGWSFEYEHFRQRQCHNSMSDSSCTSTEDLQWSPGQCTTASCISGRSQSSWERSVNSRWVTSRFTAIVAAWPQHLSVCNVWAHIFFQELISASWHYGCAVTQQRMNMGSIAWLSTGSEMSANSVMRANWLWLLDSLPAENKIAFWNEYFCHLLTDYFISSAYFSEPFSVCMAWTYPSGW